MTDPDADWVVLELSSFQLADIDTLRPDIGVVTGLAPDHLDRYPSVEAYYGDKARLFENGNDDSRWVLNGELPEVEALAGEAPGRRYRFAMDEADGIHAFVRDDVLILSVEGEEESLISRAELPLLGRHNVMNALAAGLVARLAGASSEAIGRGLASARPLANRLEPVAEVGGVLWVNDSKATNVAATVSALLSMDRPVVLLLGGTDKGEELAPLVEAAAGGVPKGGVREGGVRVALCYGEAGPRILEALQASGVASEGCAGGLRGAVARAREHASEGDVILLSPACSSFDEFENYEARGRTFSELARGVAA
jgi:UDP-N-acetylmuramoylalanine--D-glutamate ligase